MHSGIENETVPSTVRSRMHIVVHGEIDDAVSYPMGEDSESMQSSLIGPSRYPHRLRSAVEGRSKDS
jgi:hypothetical protein